MSDIVVSASWLADRLDADGVRVVDARDAWEYDGIGHVPGAVNVPFDEFRASEHAAEREAASDTADSTATDHRGMLPGADVFACLVGETGITRDDHVVAYDDHHGVFAARLLVTAELYGHPRERLHLLDGDYSAWMAEHPTSPDAPDVAAATYEANPEAVDDGPLVDRAAVEAAVGSDTVIVDTREPWEYDEGHIPGAVQLDWRDLVDEETRGLLPEGEMESILADHGITPDRHVLLYCNTARRISHTYIVLRHLGYENLAFYEGSLTEWERAGGTVETA